jgi:hypothetical protein
MLRRVLMGVVVVLLVLPSAIALSNTGGPATGGCQPSTRHDGHFVGLCVHTRHVVVDQTKTLLTSHTLSETATSTLPANTTTSTTTVPGATSTAVVTAPTPTTTVTADGGTSTQSTVVTLTVAATTTTTSTTTTTVTDTGTLTP